MSRGLAGLQTDFYKEIIFQKTSGLAARLVPEMLIGG